MPSPDSPSMPLAVRYLDLIVLALALPVFALAGFPLAGYAVAAAAWLAQRGIQHVLTTRADTDDPRTVAGLLTASMIGRGLAGRAVDLRHRHVRARGGARRGRALDPPLHNLLHRAGVRTALRAAAARRGQAMKTRTKRSGSRSRTRTAIASVSSG